MSYYDDDDDFYPGASEDFWGEKPNGAPSPDSDNKNTSGIGCFIFFAIIIMWILTFSLI